jgi:alpha-tubulin suppressor-like RCC1 family protein
LRAVPVLVVAVLASCYRPTVDPCRVTCASDSECPSGTTCTTAGVCHRDGEPACGTTDPDGGTDGAPITGVFKDLAVGRNFACAITRNTSDLVCWGGNSSGQLGDTTLVNRARARPIEEPGPWKSIGAGMYHACGIKESGELFCWGDASYGQVDGTQNNQNRPDPINVAHPSGRKWVSVDGGGRHTCAIDEDTVMWCWGSNEDGQLGTDAGTGVHALDSLPGNAWTSVTADELRTCALKNGGGGWCWGYGALGQTSTAQNANRQSSTTPIQIAGTVAWSSLSAGLGHTCGVTAANELFCFGEDQIGELGTAPSSSGAPIKVQSFTDFGFAFAGRLTTCATRTDPDRLICFGDNRDGQLGSGDREIWATPINVAGLGRLVAGGSGDGFTCVLDELGVISCFGRDDDGRCGDGVADDHFVGPSVMGLSGTIARLTASGDHTCAITTNGRVFCWGFNGYGQLGTGDKLDRAVAFEVPQQDNPVSPWADVSAGLRHTCAVNVAGELYCWGNDDAGQLGNGAAGSTTTPMRIAPTQMWQAVGAGTEFSCAIDNNSDRWCWGSNNADALGAGSGVMTRETSPILANNGAAAWLHFELGSDFGCGVEASTKELWCWGYNGSHQLGQGATPATSNVALQVQPPSADWQQIGVDQLYGAVCGIRAPNDNGGDLWCWGENGSYQLGTGNNTSPIDPTRVGMSRTWIRVDLGLDFACAISANLELFCWGYNDSKQVTDADMLSVTTIPNNPSVTGIQFNGIAAGWNHACAMTAQNDVRCWGDGGSGQLGDGNKAHLTPYPVMAPPL